MSAAERQTLRLLARPPRPEDRGDYHAHFSQAGVERWLRPAPLPPFDARTLDELLEGDIAHWETHGFGPWVLGDRASGEFVGRAGLAWTSVDGLAEVELPWSIEPSRQGEGLATEAAVAAVIWARELGFPGAVALTLPSNRASQRVAEKAGFRRDGECEHVGLRHLLFRVWLA